MDVTFIPVLSGLAGAFLGALASSIGLVINGKLETRRQLSRLAYEAALKDFQMAVELANNGGPGTILPLTSYAYFRVQYMQLIQQGKFSKEALLALNAEIGERWPVTPKVKRAG